jgi:hypothetical protein
MPDEQKSLLNTRAVNLLIALPCAGGKTFLAHNRSMRLLIARLTELGIRHQILELGTESLIPRGRNAFANICCFDKDPIDQTYTHLLFLDVDIGFNPENIVQALAFDKDIVALPYPCKMINWTYIIDAVKQGVDDPNVLSRMGSRPIVNTNDQPIIFNTAMPVEFPQLGTGVLLIKREVLLKFAEDPARRYRLMEGERNGLTRDFAVDFFQIGINPESRYYDSEDYRFSIDARKLGFETWLLPWAVTSHTGSYDFFMDIQAQAAYGIPKTEQSPLRSGFVPLTI